MENGLNSEWQIISSGGFAKGSFATYIKRVFHLSEELIGGKIVYRAGVFQYKKVYLFTKNTGISDAEVNSILVNHMDYFEDPFEKVEKIEINGKECKAFIRGETVSSLKILFSKTLPHYDDFDLDHILQKINQ